MSDDTDLRERFASLRLEQAARTPRFTQVLQRAPHSSSWALGPFAATACLAALVATLWLLPHAHAPRPHTTAYASLADWRSPMDFLLNTPSQELLRTIPEIGAPLPDILGPRLNDTTPARRAGGEHS